MHAGHPWLDLFVDRYRSVLGSLSDQSSIERDAQLQSLLSVLPEDLTSAEQTIVVALLVGLLAALMRPRLVAHLLTGEIERKRLRRRFLRLARASDPTLARPAREDHTSVRAALRLIQRSFADTTMNLERVAGHARLSKWHLSRLLRRHTGRSFSEHVRLLRIGRAEHLLHETTFSVKEIAAAVGYNSTNEFDRNFKLVRSITPTAYRQHRGVINRKKS